MKIIKRNNNNRKNRIAVAAIVDACNLSMGRTPVSIPLLRLLPNKINNNAAGTIEKGDKHGAGTDHDYDDSRFACESSLSMMLTITPSTTEHSRYEQQQQQQQQERGQKMQRRGGYHVRFRKRQGYCLCEDGKTIMHQGPFSYGLE